MASKRGRKTCSPEHSLEARPMRSRTTPPPYRPVCPRSFTRSTEGPASDLAAQAMAPQMARARQLGRFDCLNRYHVALEALREAWRSRRFTMDKMYRYARICE